CVYDCGASDVTITFTVDNANYTGIWFRSTDNSNGFELELYGAGNMILYRRVAGGFASLFSTTFTPTSPSPVSGTIVLNGSSIQVTVNGVTRSVTDSTFQTNTKHGFYCDTGTNKFQSIKVTNP